LLVLEDVNVTVRGKAVKEVTLNLSLGWSMVGGPDGSVLMSDVFTGFHQMVTWSGVGYEVGTSFEPGRGYWVLVMDETQIHLSSQVNPLQSEWGYRKKITINGSTAGSQIDYQIPFKVYYSEGTDGTETVDDIVHGKIFSNNHGQADFDDIRFTSSDGETQLDHWIQEKVDSNYAIVWVEVDTIPANPDRADIFIYYGNPEANSTSNIDDTFIFGDDFQGSSLDPDKWNVGNPPDGSSGCYYEVQEGELHSSLLDTTKGDHSKGFYFDTDENYSITDFRLFSKNRFTNLDYNRGGGAWCAPLLRDADSQNTGQGLVLRGSYYFYQYRYLDGSISYLNPGEVTSGVETHLYEVRGTTFDKLQMKGTVDRTYSGAISGFNRDFKLRLVAVISKWEGSSPSDVSVEAYYDFVFLSNYANPEPHISIIGNEENNP